MTEKQMLIKSLQKEIDEAYKEINSKKELLTQLKSSIDEWEDLPTLGGFNARGENFEFHRCEESKVAWESIQNNYQDLYRTSEDAKAGLAMAKISQLLPYYGNEITKEEWNDNTIKKYCPIRIGDNVLIRESTEYNFLAFRSEEFCKKFIDNNHDLVFNFLKI